MTDQQPITVDSDVSSVEDDSQCEVNENDLMLLRNNSWLNDKVQYNLSINHTYLRLLQQIVKLSACDSNSSHNNYSWLHTYKIFIAETEESC